MNSTIQNILNAEHCLALLDLLLKRKNKLILRQNTLNRKKESLEKTTSGKMQTSTFHVSEIENLREEIKFLPLGKYRQGRESELKLLQQKQRFVEEGERRTNDTRWTNLQSRIHRVEWEIESTDHLIHQLENRMEQLMTKESVQQTAQKTIMRLIKTTRPKTSVAS